jgi:small subunit ribosomal protein S8
MMTDPIADMLTRFRNSSASHRDDVNVPYSKVKFTIAKILEKCGFVGAIEIKEDKKEFTVKLRYDGRRPAFEAIRRISKPGHRVYVGADKLPTVRSATGVAVISTSQGLMTNMEAKDRKLGGEIICEIY